MNTHKCSELERAVHIWIYNRHKAQARVKAMQLIAANYNQYRKLLFRCVVSWADGHESGIYIHVTTGRSSLFNPDHKRFFVVRDETPRMLG
jgi:uncharacterized protein YbaR (Trm112 family)